MLVYQGVILISSTNQMVYTQFVADKNFLNNGTVGQALTIRLAGCWNDSHIDTRKTCNVHSKYFELRCLDGYLDGWGSFKLPPDMFIIGVNSDVVR